MLPSDLPKVGELRPWLQRLAQDGYIVIKAARILKEPGNSCEGGAMTDASMRAKPDSATTSDRYEFVEFGGYSGEGPVPGVAAAGVKTIYSKMKDPKLPEGVPDLTTWGRTRCLLPKVKSLNKSYAELAADGSELARDYLKWICDNKGCRKSPKVDDFANYLEAIGWQSGSDGPVIPGSKEVREYK